MKIQLISDIHNNITKIKSNADVLINAGDGSLRLDSHPYLIECKGNHDYYHTSYDMIKSTQEVVNQQINLINDYVFLSCTLWTNFWNKSISNNAEHIYVNELNDFNYIKGMTPRKMRNLFNSDFNFLKESVAKYIDKKVVIVTHFAPSKKSIHSNYRNEGIINRYFVNDLDNFILSNPNIVLYCHGHTHNSFDYMIGTTRILCNPKGYKTYDGNENKYFNSNLIITI